MSYYIIIRGPLGIGKSTIAKRLATKLRGEYVAIDDILEKYGLAKKEGQDYVPHDFLKANEFIIPQAKEKLDKGKVVVFDGNFYFKEQIENLIEKLNAEHYVFTLKAPLEVCIERDSKRKKSYGKDAAGAVHYLVSRFDYGIIIDTNKKTIGQTIKEILGHLK